MQPALVLPGLIAAALLLGGCATSRTELQLDTGSRGAATAVRADAPVAVIRTIVDERRFEQSPDEPSTPSLGFEGADKASAELKARAIGRKRGGFGKALGDVLLQPGQTVHSVVRDSLGSALRQAGYKVLDQAPAGSSPLLIDVRIVKMWAWIQPGFWAISVNTDIATELSLSDPGKAISVSVHTEESRQMVTESAWLEALQKALEAYRREALARLPAAR